MGKNLAMLLVKADFIIPLNFLSHDMIDSHKSICRYKMESKKLTNHSFTWNSILKPSGEKEEQTQSYRPFLLTREETITDPTFYNIKEQKNSKELTLKLPKDNESSETLLVVSTPRFLIENPTKFALKTKPKVQFEYDYEPIIKNNFFHLRKKLDFSIF